jgi:hypothetical protein
VLVVDYALAARLLAPGPATSSRPRRQQPRGERVVDDQHARAARRLRPGEEASGREPPARRPRRRAQDAAQDDAARRRGHAGSAGGDGRDQSRRARQQVHVGRVAEPRRERAGVRRGERDRLAAREGLPVHDIGRAGCDAHGD